MRSFKIRWKVMVLARRAFHDYEGQLHDLNREWYNGTYGWFWRDQYLEKSYLGRSLKESEDFLNQTIKSNEARKLLRENDKP